MNKITLITKNILFSIIITVLFFLMLEILSRAYLSWKYKDINYLKITSGIDHERLPYENPENLQIQGKLDFQKGGYYKLTEGNYGYYKDRKFSFNSNSLGFRGEEFSPKKKDGITRICVFGGSMIWGHGLDNNQTLPFYLSKYLGEDYEVINCGFPKYRMFEIAGLFKHEVINYDPDIIIIVGSFNDAFQAQLREANDFSFFKIHDKLYYRWMLYTILLEKYSLMKYGEAHPFFMQAENISGDFPKYLKSTIELAKNKKIEVILVRQPIKLISPEIKRTNNAEGLKDKYRYAKDKTLRCLMRHYYYDAKLQELAKENGLLIIDPLAALDGKKEYYLDDVHLNPEGARVFAEIIADEIKKTNP